MMSGLRSHFEYTITCVSDKSGRASSAMWLMLQIPPKTSPATMIKTIRRFVAEYRMSFSIIDGLLVLRARLRLLVFLSAHPWHVPHPGDCRFEPRLGID